VGIPSKARLTYIFEADILPLGGTSYRIIEKCSISQVIELIDQDGTTRVLDMPEFSVGISDEECNGIERSLDEQVLRALAYR
jgi:hypothetical protein